MNISKLANPVSQSAALSVSAACIFSFSLPSFRCDFFFYPSLSSSLSRGALSYYAFSNSHLPIYVQTGKGKLPLDGDRLLPAQVSSVYHSVPQLHYAARLLSLHGAETLPPAPLYFHRHSSISGVMKHELCLHHSPHPGTSMSNSISCSSHHKKPPSFLIMLFMLQWCRRGTSLALLLVLLLKAQHASVVASRMLQ